MFYYSISVITQKEKKHLMEVPRKLYDHIYQKRENFDLFIAFNWNKHNTGKYRSTLNDVK